MSSPRPFTVADWNHPIKRHRNVDATAIDQSTFDPVGEGESDDVIDVSGHFDPNPREDEERRDGGLVTEGQARFFTNDDVQRDDILHIYLDDQGNDIQTWKVEELVREHNVVSNLIGQGDSPRKEFLLRRETQ